MLRVTLKTEQEGKQPLAPTTDANDSIPLILSELNQKRPTLSEKIPFDQMVLGFHKWRESTTTSPSGKHLGIYRSLTKQYLQRTKATTDITPRPEPNKDKPSRPTATETATQALHIQHMLLTLAINHTHTFDRWKTIHNFFIEKIPGRPLLEKLRVIHLYKADWNLILKFFIAYKLNLQVCIEKTVTPDQAGGRPGKNAADTATDIVITNEIITLQKLPGAILYNDAKACFDRIIENISNMTLLAEGLHPLIAQLHAQTLRSARYYLKTKFGVAQIANGHMHPDPFLGTGQGAADSMPRWGFLSDVIIRAYKKKAITVPINSPFY
jgi:hypothetical protein